MSGEREAIFSALYALGQAITWIDPTTSKPAAWMFTNRRTYTPDQVPSQPCLLQAEADETFSQLTRMPSKRFLSAFWVIYLKAYDAPSPTGPLINAAMDAVELAFEPDNPNGACTLGGLVTHCWIEGGVFKDPGDLDGQAMLIVPIKILVP